MLVSYCEDHIDTLSPTVASFDDSAAGQISIHRVTAGLMLAAQEPRDWSFA